MQRMPSDGARVRVRRIVRVGEASLECTIYGSGDEGLECAPAYVLGHAFGNRVARCLAADRPALVRAVILLAAGGLITPSTPLGTAFRDAGDAKRTGIECVTLGARWLSAVSDPSVLRTVECWPMVHIAQLATSRRTAVEDCWAGGTAPLLVIQGLDDEAAPPGNGRALRDQLGERVTLVDIPCAGHFLVLEQPEAVFAAVRSFIERASHQQSKSTN